MAKSTPSKPKHSGTTGLFAQPIGKGLAQYHKNQFNESTLELIRLGTQWPEVVGTEIARFSRPIKLVYSRDKASLHISTGAALALEIQHMQPVILQRVAHILGHSKVQRIQLLQGG